MTCLAYNIGLVAATPTTPTPMALTSWNNLEWEIRDWDSVDTMALAFTNMANTSAFTHPVAQKEANAPTNCMQMRFQLMYKLR